MKYKAKYICSLMLIIILMSPIMAQAKSGLISESDEISLGETAAQKAIKKQGLTGDAGLQERANAVFDRLLPYVARKKLPYKLQVTAEKEINAYTYPGGQILVTEGLMKQISTDDELAFVLGHELGHGDEYHITKSIERSFLLGLFTSFLSKENQNLARFLGPVLQIGLSRGYGFDNEHAADRYGFNIAAQAGFNLAGGAVFFHELQTKYGEGSGSVLNFINPHPKNTVRLVKQLAYIKEYSGGRVDVPIPQTADTTAAPILIDQKPVLTIQTPHKDWSTSQRAEWIAGNISRLLHEENTIVPEKFALRVNAEGQTEIIYDGRQIIASVYAEDAAAAGVGAEILARQWLNALNETLARTQEAKPDRCADVNESPVY